jgi:hypothetical protein
MSGHRFYAVFMSAHRTAWLQDRRTQEFRDVLSRWERKKLSSLEVGEILGDVGATFPALPAALRGGLAGLLDGRLGKESARRVFDKVVWMLSQYRTHHLGWHVKHFHEHTRKQRGFR